MSAPRRRATRLVSVPRPRTVDQPFFLFLSVLSVLSFPSLITRSFKTILSFLYFSPRPRPCTKCYKKRTEPSEHAIFVTKNANKYPILQFLLQESYTHFYCSKSLSKQFPLVAPQCKAINVTKNVTKNVTTNVPKNVTTKNNLTTNVNPNFKLNLQSIKYLLIIFSNHSITIPRSCTRAIIAMILGQDRQRVLRLHLAHLHFVRAIMTFRSRHHDVATKLPQSSRHIVR